LRATRLRWTGSTGCRTSRGRARARTIGDGDVERGDYGDVGDRADRRHALVDFVDGGAGRSRTYRHLSARPTSVNTLKVNEDYLHIKQFRAVIHRRRVTQRNVRLVTEERGPSGTA